MGLFRRELHFKWDIYRKKDHQWWWLSVLNDILKIKLGSLILSIKFCRTKLFLFVYLHQCTIVICLGYVLFLHTIKYDVIWFFSPKRFLSCALCLPLNFVLSFNVHAYVLLSCFVLSIYLISNTFVLIFSQLFYIFSFNFLICYIHAPSFYSVQFKISPISQMQVGFYRQNYIFFIYLLDLCTYW